MGFPNSIGLVPALLVLGPAGVTEESSLRLFLGSDGLDQLHPDSGWRHRRRSPPPQ